MATLVSSPPQPFDISKIDMHGRLFCGLDAVVDPKCKVHPKIALRVGDQQILDKFLNAAPHQELHEAVMDHIENAESPERVLPSPEMLDKLGWRQNGKHRCGMTECGKEFDTAEHLRQHMRGGSHFPYKFYKCSTCDQEFHQKYDCNKHEKKYHPAIPAPPAIIAAPVIPAIPAVTIAPAPPHNKRPHVSSEQHISRTLPEHASVHHVLETAQPVAMPFAETNNAFIHGPSHQHPIPMQNASSNPTRSAPRSHCRPQQPLQPYPPRRRPPIPTHSTPHSHSLPLTNHANDQRMQQESTVAGPSLQSRTNELSFDQNHYPFPQSDLSHTSQIPLGHFSPHQQQAAYSPNNAPPPVNLECPPVHFQPPYDQTVNGPTSFNGFKPSWSNGGHALSSPPDSNDWTLWYQQFQHQQ